MNTNKQQNSRGYFNSFYPLIQFYIINIIGILQHPIHQPESYSMNYENNRPYNEYSK